MQAFTYFYNDQFRNASFEIYLLEGSGRYKILLADGSTFNITRLGLDPTIWVHAHGPDDKIILSPYLIQSIGDSLDGFDHTKI